MFLSRMRLQNAIMELNSIFLGRGIQFTHEVITGRIRIELYQENNYSYQNQQEFAVRIDNNSKDFDMFNNTQIPPHYNQNNYNPAPNNPPSNDPTFQQYQIPSNYGNNGGNYMINDNQPFQSNNNPPPYNSYNPPSSATTNYTNFQDPYQQPENTFQTPYLNQNNNQNN